MYRHLQMQIMGNVSEQTFSFGDLEWYLPNKNNSKIIIGRNQKTTYKDLFCFPWSFRLNKNYNAITYIAIRTQAHAHMPHAHPTTCTPTHSMHTRMHMHMHMHTHLQRAHRAQNSVLSQAPIQHMTKQNLFGRTNLL